MGGICIIIHIEPILRRSEKKWGMTNVQWVWRGEDVGFVASINPPDQNDDKMMRIVLSMVGSPQIYIYCLITCWQNPKLTMMMVGNKIASDIRLKICFQEVFISLTMGDI